MFALPVLTAFEPNMPTSLAGVVQDMSARVGRDKVSLARIERVPEEGLHVNAVFVQEGQRCQIPPQSLR